jgi:hypothetical protein
MDTKVPYSTRFTNFLFSIVLIAWAPSTTLLAQSFQPEVKGLDSKTFKQPEVKGLSGTSATPTVQGLNNNMQPNVQGLNNNTQPNVQGLNNNTQPNVQGLSSSQSSQQSSSGTSSTSSSGTASSSGTGAGSEAMKSGASAGTSSSSRPDKFFTCSRCGIEGAQAQGYCLGNFGMLTNTNGEPLKHVRK